MIFTMPSGKERAMKFSAEGYRRMSRRLHRKAQTREAARRQETLKMARAFLALAKLAQAMQAPKLSGRRIGGAKPRRSSASPPKARRALGI
jgi:hypothetical protein